MIVVAGGCHRTRGPTTRHVVSRLITWSHDSSPDAVGRTAASLTRDDSRDVFAGNSIITPAPQNGNGWRRLRRSEADKMAASIKYGKPEVHAGDATHNDVRA